MSTPPIDISEMLALIQCSFKELERLAPDEGPWGWNHPTLKQWMERHNFPSLEELLDNPPATYIVLQSLRAKIRKCPEQAEQLTFGLVVSASRGAWIDPAAGGEHE